MSHGTLPTRQSCRRQYFAQGFDRLRSLSQSPMGGLCCQLQENVLAILNRRGVAELRESVPVPPKCS